MSPPWSDAKVGIGNTSTIEIHIYFSIIAIDCFNIIIHVKSSILSVRTGPSMETAETWTERHDGTIHPRKQPETWTEQNSGGIGGKDQNERRLRTYATLSKYSRSVCRCSIIIGIRGFSAVARAA